MNTPTFTDWRPAVAAYVTWLNNVERRLASRPTPPQSAPNGSTTRATVRKRLLDQL